MPHGLEHPEDRADPLVTDVDAAEDPANECDDDDFDALFRQWTMPGRPSGEIQMLARTIPKDRAGPPYFRGSAPLELRTLDRLS